MTTPVQEQRRFPSDAVQQIAAAVLGVALIGASPRGRAGTVARMAGMGLLAFAAVPVVEKTLRRAGARRRRIVSQKSIEIARPITEVFSFFKDFESFPRVIGSLRSVVDYQDGRSHWEIYTPSGKVAAFDVTVTKYVPNSVIGWESVPNSIIEMRGIIRFHALGPTRTRIDMDIIYRPARTGFNDAVHAMVSRRPAERLNSALEHARFYLESLPVPRVEVESREAKSS